MNIYCRFFHTIKISEVNIILNYLWLHAVNFRINWKKQAWQYSINLKQVSIVSSEEFTLKMKEARQVFMMMLFSSMKAGQFTQVTLPRELTDFQDVVVTGEGLMLPLYKSVMHYIEMKNQKIPYRPLYNLSFYKLRILHEYLDDALIKGWIQHSVSSMESSVLFIFKRDGSLWLCVNYQSLNKKMIKNYHFLSLINEILDCLVGFYYFMKLNLKDVYYWIWITERDQWKTAFYIRYGHFKYLVMFFDFVNASIIFQMYINEIL